MAEGGGGGGGEGGVVVGGGEEEGCTKEELGSAVFKEVAEHCLVRRPTLARLWRAFKEREKKSRKEGVIISIHAAIHAAIYADKKR